jgi:predicted ATPase
VNDERLFVLTGAPGSGKSAILAALAADVACVSEPAREVLAAERGRGGTGTPEQDAARFVRLLLDRSIEKHATAAAAGRTTLFDRGIPDCIAYAEVLGVDRAPSLAAAQDRRYHAEILLLEPWEAIYAPDAERTMPFAATIPFHEALVRAYARTGYALVVVPRGDVAARAAHVRAFIAARTTPAGGPAGA